MMYMKHLTCLAFVTLAGILPSACSRPGAPSPESVRPVDRGDLVADIRAAGNRDDSVIRVEPLRKPGVESLLDKARAEEAARRYEAAAATLDKALALSPEAPDLLQYRAELAVRLGDYVRAEKLARKSYALGPKLGGLCARNWQTVLEMRRIAGDAASVRSARSMLDDCAKEGPVRM